jgi:hypothetical protein
MKQINNPTSVYINISAITEAGFTKPKAQWKTEDEHLNLDRPI